MSDELKPCPFCQRSNAELIEVTEYNRATGDAEPVCFEVECQQCGATQRGFETREQAVTAWNECGWSDIHDWDDPLPERCPGCKAKVIPC